jgi:hypothetical protein
LIKWEEVKVFYPALSLYSASILTRQAVHKGVHEGASRRKKEPRAYSQRGCQGQRSLEECEEVKK